MFDSLSFLYYNKNIKIKKEMIIVIKGENIQIVKGIKVTDEQLKVLHDDYMRVRKENDDYDEGSKLFKLHEYVYGLAGYWIGDNDKPDGLVIGMLLSSHSENELELDLQNINEENDNDASDYENWANEFLSENFENHEQTEFKLYIFNEKYQEGE